MVPFNIADGSHVRPTAPASRVDPDRSDEPTKISRLNDQRLGFEKTAANGAPTGT